jgi:hypothetical protein
MENIVDWRLFKNDSGKLQQAKFIAVGFSQRNIISECVGFSQIAATNGR